MPHLNRIQTRNLLIVKDLNISPIQGTIAELNYCFREILCDINWACVKHVCEKKNNNNSGANCLDKNWFC